jgi:transcriptional regulator EpsA
LRINQRKHFFSWLQGGFQSLIGHEIMVCAIRANDSETYYFDNYSSTRYFTQAHFENSTPSEHGMLNRVMTAWKNNTIPALVAPNLKAGDYGDYSVPFTGDAAALREADLINIVAHGMSDNEGNLSTFFCFSRLSREITPAYAYILELLVPHLHCALTRVMSNNEGASIATATKVTKTITSREAEVLKWVHIGKTNWEIASILSISPLTVKNHVQNILRKLEVHNRSQAANKAAKLGLFKVFQ